LQTVLPLSEGLYVSSTSTDGRKEEPDSVQLHKLKAYVSSTSTDGRKEEPKRVQLHKLKNYVRSTSTDGRKEEPKIVQLHKLKAYMQALLLQMAERRAQDCAATQVELLKMKTLSFSPW
jgi:hypothetical protein